MNETVVVKKVWGARVWEGIRDFLLVIAGIGAIILIGVLSLVIWLIPYLAYVVLPFGVAVGVGVITRNPLLAWGSASILYLIAKWLWEKYLQKPYENLCKWLDSVFDMGLDDYY